MQYAAICVADSFVSLELPAPEAEVVPGVQWGSFDAFPSPAYWAYQVHARKVCGIGIEYRLGASLKEEVGACLLGGYGIPAAVGLAAFSHLKARNAFEGESPDQATLLEWLSEPIAMGQRTVKYRFARQKAKYLSEALKTLDDELAPCDNGKALRNWLLQIPGIGFKTASWIARNWLNADDVAILDIHVYRAGILAGFFEPTTSIDRHYERLEEQFLEFAFGLNVRASELDATIWHEMMSSRITVHRILAESSDDLHPPTSAAPTPTNRF
jgi:N-glycosylase/DNA lyase